MRRAVSFVLGSMFLAAAACGTFGSADVSAPVDGGDAGLVAEEGGPRADGGSVVENEGDDDEHNEANVDSGGDPCSNSDDIAGITEGGPLPGAVVGITSGNVDAFPYQAGPVNSVAKCARLYVAKDSDLAGSSVDFGIYGGITKPGPLLGRAEFTALRTGWNRAPLDAPINVASNEQLWLAFTPSASGVSLDVAVSAAVCDRDAGAYQQTTPSVGDLPDTFNPNLYLDTLCLGAASIGP